MNFDTHTPGKRTYKPLEFSYPSYDDGQSPYELLQKYSADFDKTIPAIKELAESSKSQAESAAKIAESSKLQADTAYEVSKRADVKGWISLAVSIVCAFNEIAIHHSEIFGFFKLFLDFFK